MQLLRLLREGVNHNLVLQRNHDPLFLFIYFLKNKKKRPRRRNQEEGEEMGERLSRRSKPFMALRHLSRRNLTARTSLLKPSWITGFCLRSSQITTGEEERGEEKRGDQHMQRT
jgi:hypothetical protein